MFTARNCGPGLRRGENISRGAVGSIEAIGMSARPQPLPAPARGARIDAVLAAGLRALEIDTDARRSRDEYNDEEFKALSRAKMARQTNTRRVRKDGALEIKGPLDRTSAEFEFYVSQIKGDFSKFCERSNEVYAVNDRYILRLLENLTVYNPQEYLLWVIVEKARRSNVTETVFGFAIAQERFSDISDEHMDKLLDWFDNQYRFDLKLICSLRGLGSEMLKRTIEWARNRVSDSPPGYTYPAFYTIQPIDSQVAKVYWKVFREMNSTFPYYFKSKEMAIPLNSNGEIVLQEDEENRLTSHNEYWTAFKEDDEENAFDLAIQRQKEEARQLLERAQLAIDRGKEEESDQLLKKARKIMQAVLSALRDRYGEEEVSKHRSPASPAPSVEV